MEPKTKRIIRHHVGHKGKATKIIVHIGCEPPRVRGKKGYTTRFYKGDWYDEGIYVASTRRIEVGDVWVAAFAGDCSYLNKTLELKEDTPLGIAADYGEETGILDEEELALLRAGLHLSHQQETHHAK